MSKNKDGGTAAPDPEEPQNASQPGEPMPQHFVSYQSPIWGTFASEDQSLFDAGLPIENEEIGPEMVDYDPFEELPPETPGNPYPEIEQPHTDQSDMSSNQNKQNKQGVKISIPKPAPGHKQTMPSPIPSSDRVGAILRAGSGRGKISATKYDGEYVAVPQPKQREVKCNGCGCTVDMKSPPSHVNVHASKGGHALVCGGCHQSKTSTCLYCSGKYLSHEGEEGFASCVSQAVTSHIQHYGVKAEQAHKKVSKRDVSRFVFHGDYADDFAKKRKGLLSGEVFFGVEVEYVADPIDRLGISVLKARMAVDKFAVLKYDSTLDIEDPKSPNGKKRAGFEITSAPADKEAHLSLWDDLLENRGLDSAMKPTEKCGMHVHRSKEDLSYFVIGKILKFTHDAPNRAFVTVIAGREPNQFCDFTYEKKVTDSRKHYSGKDERDHNNNHRTAINFNTSNRRTIEFRIFRGTRDKGELLKNLEFVEAICDFCKISSLSAGYVEFVKFVAVNRGRYRYLYRFFHSDEFNTFANRHNPGLLSLLSKKVSADYQMHPKSPAPRNDGKASGRIIPDPSRKYGGAHLFPKS